jgi:hypothetical protein
MCLGVKNILSDPAMHERWGKGGAEMVGEKMQEI